jgi:PAS domain S-box-containing protein
LSTRAQQYEELVKEITSIGLNADSLQAMLADVLDQMLDFFDCDRAWFLTPCNPNVAFWHVPMERTRPQWPGAMALNQSIPMNERLQAMFRQFLAADDVIPFDERSGNPVPPQTLSEFHVKAQMAMVIHPQVGEAWLFGIHHCENEHNYSDDDIHYFRKLGSHIGAALGSLILLLELKESQHYNRTLFESSPIGQALCNMQGELLDVNQAYADIIGRSIVDIKQLGYWDITPKRYEADEDAMMAELKTSGKYGPYEKEYIHKNGHMVPVLLNGVLIDRGGEQCILSSVEDVTERVRLNRELVKQQAQLESAVEDRTRELKFANEELMKQGRLAVIGQLTATVSHELRNPLGAMKPSIYYLQKKLQNIDDPKVIEVLHKLERSINRCDNIIDELTDFTRGSRLQLKEDDFDRWLEAQIDAYPLPQGLQCTLHAGLEGRLVNFDRARMQRVLINLLDNACQAMLEKQGDKNQCGTMEVRINTRCLGERIMLSVSDSGDGIADDVLPNVFEPLYSTKGFGVGLGMPVVSDGLVAADLADVLDLGV